MKPIVKIVWEDAICSNAWNEHTAIPAELPTVTTIGFLILESDSCYVVSSTISEEEHLGSVNIPKAWVKEFTNITLEGC